MTATRAYGGVCVMRLISTITLFFALFSTGAAAQPAAAEAPAPLEAQAVASDAILTLVDLGIRVLPSIMEIFINDEDVALARGAAMDLDRRLDGVEADIEDIRANARQTREDTQQTREDVRQFREDVRQFREEVNKRFDEVLERLPARVPEEPPQR